MKLNKTKGRLHFGCLTAILWMGALLLSGCRAPQRAAPTAFPAAASPSATAPTAPQETVPSLPTPTSEPLAALVNGEGLPLTLYQAELARYQAARAALSLPEEPAEEAARRVLDELIGQYLLAQAARSQGFQPDEAALDAWVQQVRSDRGAGWDAWLQENAYTEETLRADLRRQMAAAWMRDRVVAAVPETMLQVHARQILLYNSEEAQAVYAQLQEGTDFATLAAQYDPVALGDLGWFPQGYLPFPQVEAAAFALEPGAYSPVIQTDLGYHIVQVIERDEQRPLSADARLSLQERALQDWLQTRRQQSQIDILAP